MFIKLCNLGRDAELRYTQNGKAVCNLALAYSVGYGENKRTQWVEGSLWGERAEKLALYLTKGATILIHGDDLELETYQRNDGGQGSKIKCRIANIEFVGGKQDGQSHATPQAPKANPQSQPPEQSPTQNEPKGFDNFDDDVPF